MAVNGLTDTVTVYECALGGDEGTATRLRRVTSGDNILLASATAGGDTHAVAVKKGDELLRGVRPDLIKIHAAGRELEVMAGLVGTIKNNHDISILVEYSPEHIRQRELPTAEWIHKLSVFGLAIWVIDDDHLCLRPLETVSDLGNSSCRFLLARKLLASLQSMATAS